ncbi:MAG TPA: class I SAM-dependent methyltransferase [Gemmatimonadaceae bacterium]|jgi:SAM-dependent methyltransferase
MGSFALCTLLPLVRCPHDGAELTVIASYRNGADARIECVQCRTTFLYENHILDLMENSPPVADESRYELQVRERDATSARGHPSFRSTWQDHTERSATLSALGDLAGQAVLELGSGPGFFTRALSEAGASIVGVDFSRAALRINADQLSADAPVLLVRADVTRLRPASHAFAAVLCSLYSHLATPQLRETANETVAGALEPNGRYWVGAHHQNVRRRLHASPSDDRYQGSGIFFKAFTPRMLSSELRRHFTRVRVRGVSIWIPLLSRLPAMQRLINARGGRIAGVRDFGYLLLAEASN